MTYNFGSTAGNLPTSRYVLPQFEERTPYGFKRQDPYTKLFEDRIIFLGVQVDDASADDVMAQLLVLESTDPDRDITIYINSPGGSFTAMTAIYDTMQYIRPEIQTVCLGQAASAAAVLLAAGTPGKRLALPNAPALALSRHGDSAGTAAALLGAVQFGVGAAVSPLVGLLGNDAVAIGTVVVTALVLAIGVLVVVVRPWELPVPGDATAPVAAH